MGKDRDYILIGNGKYLSKTKLKLLNTENQERLYEIYNHIARHLLGVEKQNGNHRGLITSIDLNESSNLYINSVIDPEEYLLLQDIFLHITGKFWGMDEAIDLVLGWFIYYYTSNNSKKKPLPFERKRYQRRKVKKGALKLFEERFSKYYKNHLFSW